MDNVRARILALVPCVVMTACAAGDFETPDGDATIDVPPDTVVDAADTGPDVVPDTWSDTAVDGDVPEETSDPGPDPGVCGDGVTDTGEECDDGVNDGSYGGCNPDCSQGPHCGDGNLDVGHEFCDDGVNDGSYGGCDPDCTMASFCGDGIEDPGFEECDDGPANSDTDPDACRTDCTSHSCGDAVTDGGEECDDGTNDGTYDTCNPDCSLASHCGDGITDPGFEECDDAGASPTCADTCTFHTSEAGMCSDGVDNDGDTVSDCSDGDCATDHYCTGGGLVLAYVNLCGSGVDHVTPALTNAGLFSSTTFVASSSEFSTVWPTDTWDLVIVDEYASTLDASVMDSLVSFYDAGGSIIYYSWELSSHSGHALFDRAGLTVGSSYSSPLSVYAWYADPLFTTPNGVPDLTITADHCGTDGYHAEASTGTAQAGYTSGESYDQAAIIMDSAGRFIFNTFAPQNVTQDLDSDTVDDMVELYENEIEAVF